jgi:spore coat protein U-like protein
VRFASSTLGRCALVLALLAAACSGDNNSPAAPAPTPTPTPALTTTVIYNVSATNLDPGNVGILQFNIPASGQVTATVDWTFPTSPIFIALTTDACGGANPTVTDVNNAFAGFCSNIGSPNLSSAKPKTIVGNVTGAATGRVWIANAGNVTESFGVQVTLTR